MPAMSFSASYAPGSSIEISKSDADALEKNGYVVYLKGEKFYLIGDQLISQKELGMKAFEGAQWPGGTIPYQFSPEVEANQTWKNNFVDACAKWSSVVPNVRCVPRTNESNYVIVHTHAAPRCVSFSETTGMRGEGSQVLSIYHDPFFDAANPKDGCPIPTHWNSIGTIAHEIGHVFGLVHEQNRWDRDSYVMFLSQNLKNPSDRGQLYQFRVIPSTKSTTYTVYDFQSIMHYPDTAFARAGLKTLAPAACFTGEVKGIGTRGEVTQSDGLELRHHYGLPIYDMLRERRDPSCGSTRVNTSEFKYYCEDLKEDCGVLPSAKKYSSATSHETWWCPGSFTASCSGVSGPDNSCCAAGSEPFDVNHSRGSYCWSGRKHETKWSCGCGYYTVNARCSAAQFGINKEVVEKYQESEDASLRILGLFMQTLLDLQSKSMMRTDAMDGLELALIKDFGLKKYPRVIASSRREIERLVDLKEISSAEPLDKTRLLNIIAQRSFAEQSVVTVVSTRKVTRQKARCSTRLLDQTAPTVALQIRCQNIATTTPSKRRAN